MITEEEKKQKGRKGMEAMKGFSYSLIHHEDPLPPPTLLPASFRGTLNADHYSQAKSVYQSFPGSP